MALKEIVAHKRKELAAQKKRAPLSLIKRLIATRTFPHYSLKKALSGKGPHLICELKRASPSGGVLREDFDPLKLARIYERAGASAISVLTERRYFEGNPAYIAYLKPKIKLPLLRKDFIFDEYQVYETALIGADAMLLIAAILTPKKLKSLTKLAQRFKIEVLAEAHTEGELNRILAAGITLIGINNRNLKTLKIDLKTGEKLLRRVPRTKIAVIESGIENRDQVRRFASLGAKVFLVGTSLMRSGNIRQKIRELKGR